MGWPKGKPRARCSNPSGVNGQTGVAQLDGFAESLRLLLVEEQYTAADVALMFGVSRERIRQLANKYGYTERDKWGGLFCVRVWHDGEHRFRPIHKRILHQMSKRERAGKLRRTRSAKYEARWQHAVTELRDLARVLGRTPTIKELSRVLGLGRNPGTITSYIYPRSQRNTSQSMAPLWHAAGLSMRERGGPGHTRGSTHPGARSTHCRRGHERTTENTYFYRAKSGAERQICRVCTRLRAKGA